MYNNETIISFGKYKFTRLGKIPSQYLLSLYANKSFQNNELRIYIESNLEEIKNRKCVNIGMPEPILFICDKITYPTEKEAKFKLKQIRCKNQDNKKPIRAYECSKCGGWHLTSLPIDEWKEKEKRFHNS